MLIRFSVENFRSIYNRSELSLVAMDKNYPASRNADGLGENLMTTVGIFGPNASGKSNLLEAIQWLRHAVLNSLRSWDEGIPVDPFVLEASSNGVTSFEVEYIIDNVRFEYQLEVSEEEIIYEGLFHYPLGRRKRIFEREGLRLILQDGLGKLSGARKLLTPRSLMLSISNRFDESLTSSFLSKIRGISALGLTRRPRNGAVGIYPPMRRFHGPNGRWYLEPDIENFIDENDSDEDRQAGLENYKLAGQMRSQGLALMQMADLGIVDVQELYDEEALAQGNPSYSSRRTQLVHSSGDQKFALDLHQESAGTRTWFGLVGPVLQSLKLGSLLIFDEIDASLHPRLSAELLGLFANPKTNPKNAQLIFTSHDASLLARLNRDQVWLTEKNDLGSTQLVPLTDFGGERVRRSQNLEKAYLEGRFGGIPEVDLVSVYRALGLMG